MYVHGRERLQNWRCSQRAGDAVLLAVLLLYSSWILAIIRFPLAVGPAFIVGGWNGVLKWTPVAEAGVAVVHLAKSMAKWGFPGHFGGQTREELCVSGGFVWDDASFGLSSENWMAKRECNIYEFCRRNIVSWSRGRGAGVRTVFWTTCLAYFGAKLGRVGDKWDLPYKTGLIEITTSREFYQIYSSIQFVSLAITPLVFCMWTWRIFSLSAGTSNEFHALRPNVIHKSPWFPPTSAQQSIFHLFFYEAQIISIKCYEL